MKVGAGSRWQRDRCAARTSSPHEQGGGDGQVCAVGQLDRPGRPKCRGHCQALSRCARETFAALGANAREWFFTLGAYDVVLTIDAPDDEALTRALLALAQQGNLRTPTLRGFGENELEAIVSTLG